jgi:hypothetical protein
MAGRDSKRDAAKRDSALSRQEKRRYYSALGLALRAAVVNDSGVQRGQTSALVGATHLTLRVAQGIELRFPAPLKPSAYFRVRPCDACVAPPSGVLRRSVVVREGGRD